MSYSFCFFEYIHRKSDEQTPRILFIRKNTHKSKLSFSIVSNYYLSNTMLQWRSNAFTRPNNFLLLRQLMSTWVLFLTDWVSTDSGPVLNSSSSCRANSSGVSSDLGFVRDLRENNRFTLDKRLGLFQRLLFSCHEIIEISWFGQK